MKNVIWFLKQNIGIYYNTLRVIILKYDNYIWYKKSVVADTHKC